MVLTTFFSLGISDIDMPHCICRIRGKTFNIFSKVESSFSVVMGWVGGRGEEEQKEEKRRGIVRGERENGG